MSYQAVPYTHCTAVTVKGTYFGTADCSQHPHTSTPGGAPLVLPIPSSPTVCPSQPGVGPMQCQSGQAWHSIRHSARAISALSSTRVFALHCLNFGVELRETKITPCRIVVQRVAIKRFARPVPIVKIVNVGLPCTSVVSPQSVELLTVEVKLATW